MSVKGEEHLQGKEYSIWIEIPGWCPLKCTYCFSSTTQEETLAKKNRLSNKDYTVLINEFAEIVNAEPDASLRKAFQIALPARGEPFYIPGSNPQDPKTRQDLTKFDPEKPGALEQENLGTVFHILKTADEVVQTGRFQDLKEIETILFTAAYLEEAEARRIATLIKKKNYSVLLLIKCNANLIIEGKINDDRTDNHQGKKRYIQDMIADPNEKLGDYAEKRNKALQIFMEEFSDRSSETARQRLGIVTSLIEDNCEKLEEYFEFARTNDLIFDCDTLLHQGRALVSKSDPNPTKKRFALRNLQRLDKEKFNRGWQVTPTYVGGCCHRYDRHLYITLDGKIRPCVGARQKIESEAEGGFVLGNIKIGQNPIGLKEFWDDINNERQKIVREHLYYGTCSTCMNYLFEICHSCLGRSTFDLETGKVDSSGYIKTKGCWNYRDEPVTLLDQCSELARRSNDFIKKEGHEEKSDFQLWEKFVRAGRLDNLWNGAEIDRDIWLRKYLNVRFPKPSSGRESGIHEGDLLAYMFLFPLLRVFARTELWYDPETWLFGETDLDRAEEGEKTIIRWIALFIYDDISGKYFVRTLHHPGRKWEEIARQILILRYRDAARFLDPSRQFENLICDISDVRRDKQKRSGDLIEYLLSFGEPKHHLIERMTNVPLLTEVSLKDHLAPLNGLRDRIKRIVDAANAFVRANPKVLEMLVKYGFDDADVSLFRDFYAKLPLFSTSTEFQNYGISEGTIFQLISTINKSLEINIDAENHWKIANYLMWLLALDPEMNSYEIMTSAPRKIPMRESQETAYKSTCGVAVATSGRLANREIHYLRMMLNSVIQPIENYMVEFRNEDYAHEAIIREKLNIEVQVREGSAQYFKEEMDRFTESMKILIDKTKFPDEPLTKIFSTYFGRGNIKTVYHAKNYGDLSNDSSPEKLRTCCINDTLALEQEIRIQEKQFEKSQGWFLQLQDKPALKEAIESQFIEIFKIIKEIRDHIGSLKNDKIYRLLLNDQAAIEIESEFFNLVRSSFYLENSKFDRLYIDNRAINKIRDEIQEYFGLSNLKYKRNLVALSIENTPSWQIYKNNKINGTTKTFAFFLPREYINYGELERKKHEYMNWLKSKFPITRLYCGFYAISVSEDEKYVFDLREWEIIEKRNLHIDIDKINRQLTTILAKSAIIVNFYDYSE